MESGKNYLDERQESKLLGIESRGVWIAFWGLLISIVVQMIVFGPGEFKYVIGEWVVFMVIDLYILHGCMKNNIWSRSLKPDNKTNIVISIIAGIISGVIVAVITIKEFPYKPVGCVAAGVFFMILIAALCYIALSYTLRIYKKQQEKLEREEL